MALYLDNSATTKIHPDVLEAMLNSLNDYGNSEGKFHDFSENAKKNISKARSIIASAVGVENDEVIFTSGATEANNLIIKGFAEAYPNRRRIIISAFEHSSIYETCLYLKRKGYDIIEIPVNRFGKIDLEELKRQIDDNTLLVSIMWVNNEIGTIQDMREIDKVCYLKGVFFHSDAVQALGKLNIDLGNYKALKAITITAHKIYGPKGIGALILKRDSNGVRYKLASQIHGGEQEYGFRAGTLSNELIVGFGKACEIVCNDIASNCKILKELESKLIKALQDKFNSYISLNNEFDDRISGLINVCFKGVNNMLLLKKIAPFIAASNGSNCSITKTSRTLSAIGLSKEIIDSSIRLSISLYDNSYDEIMDI